MKRAVLTALAVLVALPAAAQQLSLDIRDGLVTLQAVNVPVRQVLAEWGRVGGTKVVGAERITGAPLTLTLEGVPEAKALDIVLRGAAGFVAATRAVPGAGLSAYDRIMVLATSTPPAAGSAGTAALNRNPAARAFGVPPAVEPPESADAVNDVPEPAAEPPQMNPFANAFGQPGLQQPFGQPQPNPFQPAAPFGQVPQNPFGQVPQNPFGQPVANPFGQPLQPQPMPGQLFTPVPQAPGAAPAFIGGATTPGVIQQPPQQPQAPGVRPRPQQ
jgi:hypothetical protein